MIKLPSLNLKKPIEPQKHEIRLPAAQTSTVVDRIDVLKELDSKDPFEQGQAVDPEHSKGTLVSNLGDAIKVAASADANPPLPPLPGTPNGNYVPQNAVGSTSDPLMPLPQQKSTTMVSPKPMFVNEMSAGATVSGNQIPSDIGEILDEMLNDPALMADSAPAPQQAPQSLPSLNVPEVNDNMTVPLVSPSMPSSILPKLPPEPTHQEDDHIDRSAKTPLPQPNPLLANDEIKMRGADTPDDPNHYEVNVRRYANYDNLSDGAAYTKETQDSIKYAAKTPWNRFISDILCVLMRPIHFWEGQAQHPATVAQVHFPHLVILVVARAVATILGGAWAGLYVLKAQLVQALIQSVLIFVFVWLVALIYSMALVFVGRPFDVAKSVNYVSYAITPVLIIGLLSFIPVPFMSMLCDLLAMPYAFVVLGAGILPFLQVKEKVAPIVTAVFCGVMACLWGLLPTLVPSLMKYFLIVK